MASGIVEPSSQDSQDSQGSGEAQSPAGVVRHPKLVERLLNGSPDLAQFIRDLLTTQAVVVAAGEASAFVVEKTKDGPTLRNVAHIRPGNPDPQAQAASANAFKQVVAACLAQGKDAAIEINSPDDDAATVSAEPQFCLITILRQEGQIVAASAVLTRCLNAERARQRLVAMQIVAGYFELYNLKRAAEQTQQIAQSHQHVLQLVTAVAASHGFESAAMGLCNELASRTGAVRVTLGWLKGDDMKVVAFSHTEQFDKKQELVIELQKVMEECLDQEEPVHFVPGGTSSANVTRAAADFSRTQGGNAILSLPLRRESEIVGVMVLEFAPNARVAPQALASLTIASDLLAPQLYDRYQNDRWLITKAGLSIKWLTEKAVGPQYMLAKTLLIAGAIVLLVICNLHVMYHVSAPFDFAPVAKTTIDCPVEGYIQTVYVRPGAQVHKGDLLLQLRTVDLEKKLHQAEADAKRAQADAMKDQSDAREDPSKMGDYQVHYAQELSAEAEAQLYQLQIEESAIRAPADGEVLTGDLEDKVNSLMKQGDELFTFQATDQLRGELSVAENDIQEVIEYGRSRGGHLATTSLPSERYPFTIERIDPMGQPKDGANIFKVYATLPESGDHPEWRPGMEGEARIDIQPRRVVWIWTHKFADWLRLKAWTWL